MPAMLVFNPTLSSSCMRMFHNTLHPMQKRNRQNAASLQMQNAGQTMAANGNINITGVESVVDSLSLERSDPKSENIRGKSVNCDLLEISQVLCVKRHWAGKRFARLFVTSSKTLTLHNCH